MSVVEAAALGRMRLDGHTVTASDLAAVADLSVRQVQQLIADGEILDEERPGGLGRRSAEVSSAVARAWLRTRGVAGV